MTSKLHCIYDCVFSCHCPVVALQYKHVQEGLQKAGGKHALPGQPGVMVGTGCYM